MGDPKDVHIVYGAPQYQVFGPFDFDEAVEILEKEKYAVDDRFQDKKKWIKRVDGAVVSVAFIAEVREILNDCNLRLAE